MKRLICIMLILSLLLCSCSSTLYPLTAQGCAKINAKAENLESTIILSISEAEIESEKILLELDSLYWTDAEDSAQVPIATNLISEIQVTNRMTGLLVGLGGGLLALTLLLSDKQDENSEMTSREYQLGKGFGVLLLGIATVTAAIIGYYKGIDHNYIIDDPDQWSDFRMIEKLVATGNDERATVILDELINKSDEDRFITLALYLKMEYELSDPVAVYEELKSRFPDHIYTILAERLLQEEYGIKPVKF